MSDQETIEKLREQLRAVTQAQQAAEQREQAEKEKRQKAEEERQKAEEERQHVEEELRKEKEETRNTTLTEYLTFCHDYLSESLTVQTDKSLSTQGDPSNAKGKVRPDYLAPWKEFIDTQRTTLETLYSVYPMDNMTEQFKSRHFIKAQGKDVGRRPLASEDDLMILQRDIVETPVTQIVEHLNTLDNVRKEFALAGGFEFHNHMNSLNDGADEVDDEIVPRLEAQQLEPSTPRAAPPLYDCRPDQICVFTTVENTKKPTLVVEYKAPHKVTFAQLRHILQPDRLPLVLESVINRVKVPSKEEREAYFEYYAERLVAAVISQTFSYMVHCGTQYGYVSTGEAFIFLYIKPEEEAKTVYYHLAEPNEDVKAQKQAFPSEDYLNRTAISQVLAFTLLALKSVQEGQEWREEIIESLKTWEVDYEAILRQIPQTPKTAGEPSPFLSQYRPTTYRLIVPKRSGSIHQRLRSRKTPNNDSTIQAHQGTPPSSDDESSPSSTPTRPQGGPRGKQGQRGQRGQRGRPPAGAASSSRAAQKRAFCTQLCLQGLAQGGPLDRQCPNVSNHYKEGHQGDRHQLNGEEFRVLLGEQLRQGRGDAVQPLGMQGARGALFKVTLTSHGYTVAGKGTVRAFIKKLRHEAEIYRRLVTLQAIHIPIYLGSIDLDKPIYYDTGVRIMHLMLLSWAGKCLEDGKTAPGIDRQTWTSDLVSAINAVHAAGVLHGDIRMPNVLWNEETKRVMVIDFEEAEIVKEAGIVNTLRQALSPISPNRKRKRALGTKEVGGDNNMLETMKEDRRIQNYVHQEISRMQCLGKEALRTIQASAGLDS